MSKGHMKTGRGRWANRKQLKAILQPPLTPAPAWLGEAGTDLPGQIFGGNVAATL